ncbi:tryptophanyl-tRNA synthetase [Halovenus aranensis]|uniref:Tryptophan--tRNA ligase n=1 Tax=Halovenus aranensis TaxID=890420 RepID=A0A1G8XCW1_9EURY|nr:tryptophan--tRNA ligase [Halovenus aranensis]SDJ88343.1 tryptophanyl-tRNA synthetase [Halovenus aranensis]
MTTQDDFTVTPHSVDGDVDYDQLLDQFGADEVTPDQCGRFPGPGHPLVRRGVFYAHRDLDRFLDAATAGGDHALVTGVGPSGPMHIGHVFPFYFAKYLQETAGTTVYIPFSDDEKYLTKDQSLDEIGRHTLDNLRDILAVGFDPERTRLIVDSADADVVYPLASALSNELTQATVDATYGEPENVGLSFYPAVQATHLLLPQLVEGRQPTLVPIGADQDPHVRVCRDVAGKERYDIEKPSALLSKFLPSLDGPGKMSASDDAPNILLTDDRETIREKILTYAYSGGQSSVADHREQGGDPEVDISFLLLYYFFEDDDEEVERLAREYREGSLLSGELKEIAAEKIANFFEGHQQRRDQLGSLGEELEPYRLTEAERRRALGAVGYPDDALVRQQR